MLATSGTPFDSADHLFELKWDGFRTMAPVEHRSLRLISRGGRDVTAQYPALAPLAALPDGSVVDGEIVALDADGVPDCEWLRHITEVRTVRRTWWRTHWQSWPPLSGQTRQPREVRIALDCDPESPVQMFQLYAALADDEKPIGAPELRTFQPDVDTEMPAEAAVVLETNGTVADLLEWIAWLLFDGRRSAPR